LQQQWGLQEQPIPLIKGLNMSNDLDTLLENALAAWVRNKLRSASSVAKRNTDRQARADDYEAMRNVQDGKVDIRGSSPQAYVDAVKGEIGRIGADRKGLMDRDAFVSDAIKLGPKQAYELLDPMAKPEVPALLRRDLRGVIGPYRPFEPGQKKVGVADRKVTHTPAVGSFIDANSGLRYSKSGSSVEIPAGVNPDNVEVPLKPGGHIPEPVYHGPGSSSTNVAALLLGEPVNEPYRPYAPGQSFIGNGRLATRQRPGAVVNPDTGQWEANQEFVNRFASALLEGDHDAINKLTDLAPQAQLLATHLQHLPINPQSKAAASIGVVEKKLTRKDIADQEKLEEPIVYKPEDYYKTPEHEAY
jgi:hypothetical protein